MSRIYDTFFTRYLLDFDKEVIITVKYEAENSKERITKGGLKPDYICLPKIERKYLKPRSITTKSLGRIYFYSFEKMVSFINDNSDDIYQIFGE